jgi:hypothetical protein
MAFFGSQYLSRSADNFTSQADFAILNWLEPGYAAQRSSLSATRGTEQAANLAFAQVKAQVVNDMPHAI